MIVKTNFIPKGFDAITVWPFIFVKDSQSNNAGLIEHEMVHFREQAWIAPIWWLRYLLSRNFRLQAEVRAYRRQIVIGGISTDDAVKLLLTYKTNITRDQAVQLLIS